MSTPRVVAVFDFDHTLSDRDNVLPFCVNVAGRAAVVRALVAVVPDVLRRRRDAAKAKLVHRLFTGRPDAQLRDVGRRFSESVLEHHLRADVVTRAEWHRAQGHERVIVSASFDHYLCPIGAGLGFDDVVATELALDADARATGELEGANVRGAEKVRRLEAWLGDEPATIWAYGDSSGDRELLARADHPVLVGRARLTEQPQRTSDPKRVAR